MPLQVLNTLPEETKVDAMFTVARLETDAWQALKAIEETAWPEIRALLQVQGFSGIGGTRAAAEILRRVGRPTETAVMEQLDERYPEIAEGVRSHLIAFGDIYSLTDREIQMILREVDTKDLAVALRGGSKEVRDRILMNVNKKMRKKIREEMEFTGPVRVSDVEEMQLRVVHVMRKLEDAGQVTPVRCSKEALV